MAKNIKKLFALILAASMVMSLSVNTFAMDSEETTPLQVETTDATGEPTDECATSQAPAEECSGEPIVTEEDPANESAAIEGVAKIGEVGYESLADAIADANAAEGAVEIELLEDITLSKGLTVKNDITISGEFTITRGIAGTLFTVNKGASLTLDGGLTIDGGNDWTFDSENFYEDMADGLTLSTGAKNSYTASEEGGIVATAAMIAIKAEGEVVVNEATIQNNWGSPLFNIPANAVLTTNDGSVIRHIRSGNGGSVAGQVSGLWTMEGGLIEDIFGHNTNGGVVDIRNSGVVTINGGEITDVRTFGLNANSNGILAQVYGEKAKLNINGGYIHDNASFAPGNGWGSVVYLNRGGDFTMTGGTIEATVTDHCSAFVANAPTSIELLGGTMEIDPSLVASFDSLIYGNVNVGEDMEIIGTEDSLFCMLGDKDYTLNIDGEISGDGLMWLMYNQPVTGNGTITSDVLVKADPDYFEHDGKVTIAEANWLDSLITVNSIDSDASLTVKPDASIDGIQIRVLDSVPSGNSENDDEAAAAQAAAYIEEEGANVESPVLFFHRLTSAQQQNIVVTYDYNGGLDAQGWSGIQRTTDADAFTTTPLPAPTKGDLELIGWVYADDNDPECLDMDGDVLFEGEAITADVRLIAQWAEPGATYTVTYMNGDEVLEQYTGLKTGDGIPEFEGEKPSASGKKFSKWALESGKPVNVDGKEKKNGKFIGTTDLVYQAKFKISSSRTPSNEIEIIDEEIPLAIPSAFSTDHFAYIIGRDDGLVHPEANITRAEVATIFFRLLADEIRNAYMTDMNRFSDVEKGQWYNNAISTLSAMGIIYGKGDGTYFAPNDYITRAEFAAIAARFDPFGNPEGAFFSDIAGHWAEKEIIVAANNGWVHGYNGMFRPDDLITRAEAMTLVNNVLQRNPETEGELLDDMIIWPDNMDTEQWYYLAVQEATNSHDYGRKENAHEFWTALQEARDWSLLEK